MESFEHNADIFLDQLLGSPSLYVYLSDKYYPLYWTSLHQP